MRNVLSDETDEHGITVLHVAAKRGHKELVKYLVEKVSMNPSLRAVRGITPLHCAAQNIDKERAVEMASYLISVGADVDAKLHVDHEDDVQSIALIFRKEGMGPTPLHWAVRGRNKEMVRLLASKGADLEYATVTAWTALSVAIVLETPKGGQPESASTVRRVDMVKLLLDLNADPNNCGGKRIMPLLAAAAIDDKEIMELLIGAGAALNGCCESVGQPPLFGAVVKGKVRAVTLLLDHGADVNFCCLHVGGTALMAASGNGDIEMVKLLIGRGADPNIITKTGYHALYFAIERGAHQVMRLLIEGGAKADISLVKECYSSLWFAMSRGDREAVSILLEGKSNVNQIVVGRSFEIKRPCLPTIGLSGCNYYPSPGQFSHPLLLACCHHHDANQDDSIAMFKLLVENGADLQCRDSEGRGVVRVCMESIDRARCAATTCLRHFRAVIGFPGVDLNQECGEGGERGGGEGGDGCEEGGGETPLTFLASAIPESNAPPLLFQMLRDLIGAGASPLLPNAKGKTPVQCARNASIISVLEQEIAALDRSHEGECPASPPHAYPTSPPHTPLNKDSCSICLVSEPQCAFAPCGHLCVCAPCAKKVALTPSCPICRAPAESILRIYF